jgi:hypothetical protein
MAGKNPSKRPQDLSVSAPNNDNDVDPAQSFWQCGLRVTFDPPQHGYGEDALKPYRQYPCIVKVESSTPSHRKIPKTSVAASDNTTGKGNTIAMQTVPATLTVRQHVKKNLAQIISLKLLLPLDLIWYTYRFNDDVNLSVLPNSGPLNLNCTIDFDQASSDLEDFLTSIGRFDKESNDLSIIQSLTFSVENVTDANKYGCNLKMQWDETQKRELEGGEMLHGHELYMVIRTEKRAVGGAEGATISSSKMTQSFWQENSEKTRIARMLRDEGLEKADEQQDSEEFEESRASANNAGAAEDDGGHDYDVDDEDRDGQDESSTPSHATGTRNRITYTAPKSFKDVELLPPKRKKPRYTLPNAGSIISSAHTHKRLPCAVTKLANKTSHAPRRQPLGTSTSSSSSSTAVNTKPLRYLTSTFRPRSPTELLSDSDSDTHTRTAFSRSKPCNPLPPSSLTLSPASKPLEETMSSKMQHIFADFVNKWNTHCSAEKLQSDFFLPDALARFVAKFSADLQKNQISDSRNGGINFAALVRGRVDALWECKAISKECRDQCLGRIDELQRNSG